MPNRHQCSAVAVRSVWPRAPLTLARVRLVVTLMAVLGGVFVARSGQAEDPLLRIAVVADLNERYGDAFHRDEVHRAVDRIVALSPDLVLIAGDMVAGQRSGLDYESMWRAFHAAVTDKLGGLALAISPGNHDASGYEGYAEERRNYQQTWAERAPPEAHPGIAMVDGSDYPFRYSFTMGPVFFIALDVTHRGSLAQDGQLEWVEGQLSRADPEQHPVRILFGHLPLYPFTQGRERDYLLTDDAVRSRFLQLVAEYRVSLYISGHHHGFYPGRDPQSGLRMLGAGCLGGGPRPLLGEERVIDDLNDPRERSFVWLEVDAAGIRSLEAFRGPDFGPGDRIERGDLPERIGLESTPLVRDDL